MPLVGSNKFAEASLKKRLEEIKTNRVAFGVLLANIDRFLIFNDVCGHNLGDRVITMVAQTISNLLPSKDVVARWKGGEFIIIILNVNGEILRDIAEIIRVFMEKNSLTVSDLERSLLKINDENLKVTVSIAEAMAKEKEAIELLIEITRSIGVFAEAIAR